MFDAIVSEQNVLIALYAPLMARLASSSGTLRKLSFSVSRVVDGDAWGDFAEERLIDCRKSGPFYGRGSLINAREFRTQVGLGNRERGFSSGGDG